MVFRAVIVSMLFCSLASAQTTNEAQAIDQELESLEAELHRYRERAFNNEMEAQPYRFFHWRDNTEEVRLNEEDEKHILSIKDRIRILQERKKQLDDRK